MSVHKHNAILAEEAALPRSEFDANRQLSIAAYRTVYPRPLDGISPQERIGIEPWPLSVKLFWLGYFVALGVVAWWLWSYVK